ncbi:MAG: right-handed parallel beta-helix repeat-containing protein, partial [Actinomycetota bacterium]|nr:right-handed parallel beta-helix repeat-containing protein [Actinomycetota bacterium]
YTITYSGQTTTALAFGAGWFEVHQALEFLNNIQDVVVTGAGSAAAPFVIEFLDPSGDVATMTTTATGGIIYSVVQGGVPSLDGWTQSFHPQTGLIHGTYDKFEVTSVSPISGTYSLLVNNGATLYPTDYGGAQQVVSVTGGRTYRGEIWVDPTFTGYFRLIVRTMDETAIDGAIHEQQVTAGVPTKFTIPPFRVPKHIDQVIFRIGNLQSTDTGDWRVDGAVLAPGFPAATLGLMMSDIRTAALAAGAPLAWITPTWTTTLDSDGAAWDSARKWNVNHDQTIYQLIEYARGWNYESRIRWDVADNRFEWDMWNPGGGGQTRTVAITGKSGVTGSAPIVRKPPGATYMRVEGDLGAWGEYASTTLDDVWGRLEKSHRDRQGVNSAELDIFAQRLIDRGEDKTASRTVRLGDPSVLPWANPAEPTKTFEPGDIVTLNLAPKDTKQALRVAAIVVSRRKGQPVPDYDAHFGSPVYSNEAALAQGLRTLYRIFNRPAPSIPAGKTNPMLVGEGSTPTVVVAAANSTPGSKGGAQFHCLGTDDHKVIQQAMTWLAGQGGGRLVMCEGDYNLGGTIVITGHVWIEGMGRGSTVLKMQASANANGIHISAGPAGGCRVTINHLTLDGTRATNTTGNGIFSPQGSEVNLNLVDCDVAEWTDRGIHMERTGGVSRITQCRVYNNDDFGVYVLGEGYHFVTDSLIHNNGGGVYVTGASAIVSGCRIFSNAIDGINHQGNSAGPYHVIVGNKVHDNGGGGIYLANTAFGGLNVIASNNVHDNVSNGIQVAGSDGHIAVTGNISWANDGAGIYMGISGQTVIGGVISGNQVGYNGTWGIVLDQVHRCLVTGNHVTSNSKLTNITYDGIVVAVNSDDNFITANKVYDTAGGNGQRYGINVRDANCDNNVYVGNDARGSGRTADYNDAGTGSINAYAGGAGPGDNF